MRLLENLTTVFPEVHSVKRKTRDDNECVEEGV